MNFYYSDLSDSAYCSLSSSVVFTQDVPRGMESNDVIATPEGAVRDSIIEVCCKGLLDKGLLSGFHLVWGGGGEYVVKETPSLGGLGKISSLGRGESM